MSAWSIYWIVITIILLIALFIKPYIALLIGLILAVAYVFGKKVFFIVNGASVLILLIIAIIYVVRCMFRSKTAGVPEQIGRPTGAK
jgi:membrane protein implicated in regulation of membrane protease activity